MNDPNRNDPELRLVVPPDPAVRVVLAEVDAPGSLHYLLEAEGFQVVGCASDDVELGRVLEQDLDPDVIVLDADVMATSTLVARALSPSAHVIVIWPDGVQTPPMAERVSPALVYEELGPTIRRYSDSHAVPEPIIMLPNDEPEPEIEAPGPAVGRAASRVSVTTVALIAAIVLTMGAAFALGGYREDRGAQRPGIIASKAPTGGDGVSTLTTGRESMRGVQELGNEPCARAADASACGYRSDKRHAEGPAAPRERHGDGGNQSGSDANTASDPVTGGNQGPPSDPGGDQGDQGGGQGDQGNQDDQGQDDQGQDDQGQDDQGQDDQGQDDQGQDEQGDQGGGQGDQGSGDEDDQGSQDDTHGSQSDDQDR